MLDRIGIDHSQPSGFASGKNKKNKKNPIYSFLVLNPIDQPQRVLAHISSCKIHSTQFSHDLKSAQ